MIKTYYSHYKHLMRQLKNRGKTIMGMHRVHYLIPLPQKESITLINYCIRRTLGVPLLPQGQRPQIILHYTYIHVGYAVRIALCYISASLRVP